MTISSQQFGQQTIDVVLNEGQMPAKLSTDSNGNTVLVGPDGPYYQAKLSGETPYPAFHTVRPLASLLIPFGSTAINDSGVTGTTTARSVDTAVTFNGKSTSKIDVGSGGTTTNLDVGVNSAVITLDSDGQAMLTRTAFFAVKTDGANTVSGGTLYLGDTTYANFYTFGLGVVGNYDGWTLLSTTSFGAASTTGSPNLAAAVRAKMRVVCSEAIS